MVRIADIVKQNAWWKQGKEFVQYDEDLQGAQPIFFKRKEIILKHGGIYILRGPRQVGKTTYLKETIKNLIEDGIPGRDIFYLSLDSFTSRREMRNAIEYFLNSTRDSAGIYLLLDEITSVEDWNLELKFIADQGITERGVVLATGSSALKLKEKGELLPGRGLEGNEYYIKPLSFREFVLQTIDHIVIIGSRLISEDGFVDGLKGLKAILKESLIDINDPIEYIRKEVQKVVPFKRELDYLFQMYLKTGGFPKVINHYLRNRYGKKEENIEANISEIFIRAVLGDLSRIQKQESVIRQLLKAILEKYSSKYSFSTISRELERTHVTTINYLEFLEDSFISFILYAYDFNKKEPKWKGDKKVYFFDPFVFHTVGSFLAGEGIWDTITKAMEDEELQSKLVEGIVISHLLLHQERPYVRTGKTFLWSYYDKSGREIDAIVKEKEGYSGVEVKYRSQLGEIRGKNIEPIRKYILLSKEDVGEKDQTMIIPVDIFLALLPSSEQNL